MNISVTKSSKLSFAETETCLVVPVYEQGFPLNSDVLTEQDELVFQALADKEVIRGKAKECYFLPTPSGAIHSILVAGLGKKEAFQAEVLRRTGGEAGSIFQKNRIDHVYVDISHHGDLPVEAFLEGLILGQYDFDVYKEKDDDSPTPVKVEHFTVIVSADSDAEQIRKKCEVAALICLSANGARHLANTPANEMTPAALAEFAQGIADKSSCECTILEETQMATLGMNALLGVAAGTVERPRLIVLNYHHGDSAKTVAIVGKGVTFDSGGISLKPSEGMHEMKFDMCGAAAVLCAMMSLVELKPAINLVCVVPAVENKTGAAAQRPGDIVTAYNGKTIEVHNTDAEGRLILADAMAYTVDKYKPDCMVNLATLTGACVVALGHYAAGLFSNDVSLTASLTAAGEASGERVWPFPLWDDYSKLIEGNHADICNIGPRMEAGSITAACFLKHFVGDTPWAHLDIAGTAWGGKHLPHLDAKHATGYGVRLLTRWILELAK
jgi:leucyl aminopeptidase